MKLSSLHDTQYAQHNNSIPYSQSRACFQPTTTHLDILHDLSNIIRMQNISVSYDMATKLIGIWSNKLTFWSLEWCASMCTCIFNCPAPPAGQVSWRMNNINQNTNFGGDTWHMISYLGHLYSISQIIYERDHIHLLSSFVDARTARHFSYKI